MYAHLSRQYTSSVWVQMANKFWLNPELAGLSLAYPKQLPNIGSSPIKVPGDQTTRLPYVIIIASYSAHF